MSPSRKQHLVIGVTKLGFVTSLLFIGSLVALGDASVDPTGIAKSIVDVAGKDTALACMYILGLVTLGALWFSWQQFKMTQAQVMEQIKVNQELSTALTKFATKLDRAKCMAEDPR